MLSLLWTAVLTMESTILWSIMFFTFLWYFRIWSAIIYTRGQLLALSSSVVMTSTDWANIPYDLRRTRHGNCTGIRRQSRGRRYRHVIKSIILGNVRSLPNKVNELVTVTCHWSSYRESSLICLTETWLTALTPDSNINMEGFHLLHANRTKESGKTRVGGLAVCEQ